MKQRILSFFLALLTLFGLFSTAAFAADTPEAALGEVNIYNGEHELDYLSINGAVKNRSIPIFSMRPTTARRRSPRPTASTQCALFLDNLRRNAQ